MYFNASWHRRSRKCAGPNVRSARQQQCFFLYDIGFRIGRLLSIIDNRNTSDMPCGRAYSSAWRTRHWTARMLPAVTWPNSNTGHGTAWQAVCRPPYRKPFRLRSTALKRTCRWVVVVGPCHPGCLDWVRDTLELVFICQTFTAFAYLWSISLNPISTIFDYDLASVSRIWLQWLPENDTNYSGLTLFWTSCATWLTKLPKIKDNTVRGGASGVIKMNFSVQLISIHIQHSYCVLVFYTFFRSRQQMHARFKSLSESSSIISSADYLFPLSPPILPTIYGFRMKVRK